MNHKKLLLKFTAIAVILLIIMILLITKCSNDFKDPLQNYFNYVDSCESQLGRKIVIDDDTLILLSYDANKGTFILSNGIKIDTEAIKKIGLLDE